MLSQPKAAYWRWIAITLVALCFISALIRSDMTPFATAASGRDEQRRWHLRRGSSACPPGAASAGLASGETLFFAAERTLFTDAFLATPPGTLGHCDASTLVPMLSRIPPAPGATAETPHLIIDIGANVGDTTDKLIQFFTSAGCLSYHAAFPEANKGPPFDSCVVRAAKVLSYEPMPANFNALVARGAHAHWLADFWSAYPIAVTSPARVPASGMVDFFSAGNVGDQQGAFTPRAGGTDSAHKISVVATTLDAHLAVLGFYTTPILLLKIDTEGFDAEVLSGASGIITRQQARIITFEYNSKWTEAPGTSLATTIKALSAAAYDCFLVTPSNLIPLTNAWWHESYEMWTWSNVICFRRCDQIIQHRILAFYNELDIDPAIVIGCAPPATCMECAA